MKHLFLRNGRYPSAGAANQGRAGQHPSARPNPTGGRQAPPPADGPDAKLLAEIETLLGRLGGVKISLTLYQIEFNGLPPSLAAPVLHAAAGRCALLRRLAAGHHLVIFLGPEPSPDTGGFLVRLSHSLLDLAPGSEAQQAPWAEARTLRRCNHDVAAPDDLLRDLSAAEARTIGPAKP